MVGVSSLSRPRGIFPPKAAKAVRRIQSVPSLRHELPSSEESVPEDSIYNAEPVRSRENLPWTAAVDSVDAQDLPTPLDLPSPARIPLSRHSTSHSNWPTPQLNPIVEHRTSLNSVLPDRSTSARKSKQASVELYRRRSFSVNDLDCVLRQDTILCNSTNSTSSEESIHRAGWCPSFPIKPPVSPPARVSTPPGLPPFGTEQATFLRLVQQRPTGRPSFWNRIWRRTSDGSDEQAPTSLNSEGSPRMSAQNPSSGPSNSVELFERTLAAIGMATIVEPPRATSSGSRASLPRGVYKTNIPGPLARADDGTLVRGRFGPRASGHGIGSRNLESHPLGRLRESSAIQQAMREIDKACERTNVENALLQSGSGVSHTVQRDGWASDEAPTSPTQLHPRSETEFCPPFTSPTLRGNSLYQPGIAHNPVRTEPPMFSLLSLDSATGGPRSASVIAVRETDWTSGKRRKFRNAWRRMWYVVKDCWTRFWRALGLD
ncbi:uncharacterized protein PV07_09016 [Cladophialophora immunda]|uniref:Uncharacterized protein n=1 Tax=Cladophialophora immunda TaxID=569365 RepID=A0A0D2C5W1_9EURO|nr:uncharacterized protein PV07_09016 [Cladophialophora immunda]KIW25880.1 hypothetical protein PV07_09016 [Cladophialophora immunda]